jgi:Flp pilus assembly protein TadD
MFPSIGINMLTQQNIITEITNIKDILCSAKAKYRIGDYQGAIVEYTLAIQFAPNVAVAFSCRGDAYSKLGKVAEAMSRY